MSSSDTIEVLGYTIPVWDYYTAGEREALELLIASQDEAVKGRYDVEVVRIFLRTRCKKNVKIDTLLEQPVYGDELAEAVEVLCNPFFETLKQRALRREKQRVARLTHKHELLNLQAHHRKMLEIVDGMLSDSGAEPEH